MKYSTPRPPQYKLRVGKSSAGQGLFAEQEIPHHRFIVEYFGDIINDDEAQKIGGRYLFDLENGKTINGASRHNIARYINHRCRPNAEARQVGNRIYLFSVRKINPGDEISYHYGKEYCDEYIKPHGCKCPSCIKKNS